MGYPTGYSGRMMIPDIWQDYWIPDIPTFFKKLGAGYPAKVDIQADNILSTDIMIYPNPKSYSVELYLISLTIRGR